MQILHPYADMNGAPRDNIFLVTDDAGNRAGTAAVVEYVNHALLSNRPLNFYISLNAKERARDMLFGAALARALMLRRQQPNLPARIYSPCDPNDKEKLYYFMQQGFANDDAEWVMRWRLHEDQAAPRPPVGCRVMYTPLETQAQCEALLARCNPFFHTAHTMDWLNRVRQEPLFAAYGMLQEDDLLGEMIMSGYGAEGRVHMVYTVPKYRRRGVAKALLGEARKLLLAHDIKNLTMEVWQRNHPAAYLCESMGFEQAAQTMLYPGINI